MSEPFEAQDGLKLRPPKAEEKSRSLGCARDDKRAEKSKNIGARPVTSFGVQTAHFRKRALHEPIQKLSSGAKAPFAPRCNVGA
jgi:hypothetical protein